MPGARAPRLYSEAMLLKEQFEFQLIVVSVGANYVPNPLHFVDYTEWVPEAIDETISLLEILQHQFPLSHLSLSPILPQPRDFAQLDGINFVNRCVSDFCGTHSIGELIFWRFRRNKQGTIDRRLFAKDGVHLSYAGVEAVEKALYDHIRWNKV